MTRGQVYHMMSVTGQAVELEAAKNLTVTPSRPIFLCTPLPLDESPP